MVVTAKDESLFLKSPKELLLLFGGGEVTTEKPIPDPIPEVPKETVPLVVKSASNGTTVVSNHESLLEKLNPFSHGFGFFGAAAHDPSKDPNLMLLKAQVTIMRANVAGIDVGNAISDLIELAQEVINNRVTFQLASTEIDPGKLALVRNCRMLFEARAVVC